MEPVRVVHNSRAVPTDHSTLTKESGVLGAAALLLYEQSRGYLA